MSDKARRLFEALDLDHDGVLTRVEVIVALRTNGPSLAASGVLPFWGVQDVDASSALFDTADQNGDAVLTLDEFTAVVDRRFGWS
ncbi:MULTISPECIES: EF-hand domain-containing protein [Streptomyces]|uniref:EF-hand domain-containing protein n=1 Tax=Streptomyces koelreuteriae TaxID=2838015 RepID=A0ABX8G3C1_9ACTN|nr:MULTISPECIES: EF-hand domain-containing protein [Streptomyces]QWB28013.1 EF-hand domain-containing protein [Streptomyces koelreuteriae]UUA11123.1 EF-hand domain-containing protein [Streptomyces koelreuteriae]UUA18728.1 EF-hand domain-containing protein [Streptomyces sp. CRCS-T-1]